MVAWHQREARFALRYQTHLTVVRLIDISRVDGRGAGVSACLIMSRLATHTHDVPVFSSRAFSTPENLVLRFPVLRLPVLRFQSPHNQCMVHHVSILRPCLY